MIWYSKAVQVPCREAMASGRQFKSQQYDAVGWDIGSTRPNGMSRRKAVRLSNAVQVTHRIDHPVVACKFADGASASHVPQEHLPVSPAGRKSNPPTPHIHVKSTVPYNRELHCCHLCLLTTANEWPSPWTISDGRCSIA